MKAGKVFIECLQCKAEDCIDFDGNTMPEGTHTIKVSDCIDCIEHGGFWEEQFFDKKGELIKTQSHAEFGK